MVAEKIRSESVIRGIMETGVEQEDLKKTVGGKI